MTLNAPFKIALPFLIIALSIGSYSLLKSTKAERKTPQKQEKVWQVATINVQLEELAADLTLYATIESPSLLSAAAPAAAIVESVFIKSGDYVKQGDTLVILEQQDFINRVNQAKADILDIEAQQLQLDLTQKNNQQALSLEQQLVKLSQAELNRVNRLKQKGLGSASVLTEAKSALAKQQLAVLKKAADVALYEPKKQQLNAKLMNLTASLNQANLALARSVISANFDGIISSVDVAQGDSVKTAQKLFSLYPNQQLEAKTRIPAAFQQEVQLMLFNKLNVEATASIANHPITMQLERMAGKAAANGTEVYFRITSGQKILRVGNFLKLKVQRPKEKNVVKLPLQALYGTGRIYLLKEGRLEGLNIETIGHYKTPDGQQHILIRHPSIKNGDQIVTTHLPNAITGLKVKSSEK